MRKASLTFIGLAAVLLVAARPAHAQRSTGSKDRPAPKRITIENLITAAPLPEDYWISRENFLDGDRVVGHKLLLTKERVVSKVIVQIQKRKLTTREEKAAAAKEYVIAITESFHEAGLKVVEKKLPDLGKSDFRKRMFMDLIYERPGDGSRLYVQMQVYFTDLAHTVLVISDSREDHAMLTRWARSVLGK
jgi:hypothetical protein